MALSFVASGAWIAGTASAAPARPTGHAVDDQFLTFVVNKPHTTTPPSPSGYDLLATAVSGTGVANGAGVGGRSCGRIHTPRNVNS